MHKTIRVYRQAAGLTQRALATRLRVSQPTIARWESKGAANDRAHAKAVAICIAALDANHRAIHSSV